MTFSCLPENNLEESISFLRFNTRADNVLKRNGVDTIGALLEVLILPEWIQHLSCIEKSHRKKSCRKWRR